MQLNNLFQTTPSEVPVSVTSDKWKKGKTYVKDLLKLTGWNPDLSRLSNQAIPETDLDFKRLERVQGYMCHLAMTFPVLFLYLKGFHLTLCSHFLGRDKEGQKRNDLEEIG